MWSNISFDSPYQYFKAFPKGIYTGNFNIMDVTANLCIGEFDAERGVFLFNYTNDLSLKHMGDLLEFGTFLHEKFKI